MINITRDSMNCFHRQGDKCCSGRVTGQPSMINNSLCSRWFCSICKHYTETDPGPLKITRSVGVVFAPMEKTTQRDFDWGEDEGKGEDYA
jgi:hypothetical protein